MKEAEIERRAELADDYIMHLCEPDDMKPEEAFDFLERVIERLRMAQGALIEENPELER